MSFWRNHGPMQHVTTGARPGTIPGGGHLLISVLITSRTSSRPCLIFLRQKKEDKGNKCAWIKSIRWVLIGGASFLPPSLPRTHALLGICMHLLASRGVKNSECLGVASSDDREEVPLLIHNY